MIKMTTEFNFIPPVGADDVNKVIHAHWTNYMTLIDAYIRGDCEAFMFVSYKQQLQWAEERLMREICNISPNSESFLEVFRESYNRNVADIKMIKRRGDVAEKSILDMYENVAAEMLQRYNEELEQQQRAASIIQSFYKSHK